MVATWLPNYEIVCPDVGLKAYSAMPDGEKVLPRIFLWIGILLALEQAVHAIALLVRSPAQKLRVRVSVVPAFAPPLLTTLAWVLFTSLSIVLIGVTFRSSAAILGKTLHVFAEAVFLIGLTSAFNYTTVAGMVGVVATIAVLLVLSLPCTESIEFASRAGMALDAINFLSYAWYGFSLPDDKQLWLFIWALGCHVIYLLTAITVSRDHGSDDLLVGLRIVGLYANILASELFLMLSRRELRLDVSGAVDLQRWRDSELETEGDILCVWSQDGIHVLGNVVDCPRIISPFALGKTAYTEEAQRLMLFACFPLVQSAHCDMANGPTKISFALLCAFNRLATLPASDNIHTLHDTAFVLGWWHVRMGYQLILIMLAIFIALVWP